ncbi:MAG: protein-export chaperone SecB [Rickettsiales bacterium]|jgi:preprotein translocase subunit SecB|nr:protein-export chaperone SecB [Rickettsiales bacterium]
MISRRTGAEIGLDAQYIKDLSFENPRAPEIYATRDLKPTLDVSLDIGATKLQREVFEVEIVLGVSAVQDGSPLFILEMTYAGIFSIGKVSEELVQENLFIECPEMLYPFARRILWDTVRDANFPPPMLEAVDFEALYNSKKDTLRR